MNNNIEDEYSKTFNRIDNIQISKKKGDLYFKRLTKEANNIYNLINFYIRQSYFYTSGSQNEQVIKAVQTINEEIIKYNKQKEEKDKLKLITNQGMINLSQKMSTIYYNIIKNKPLSSFPDHKNPYLEIPTSFVQSIITQQVLHDWKAFFAGLREYKKDKSKFTGRPKPPKFKDKGSQCLVVIMGNGFHYLKKKVNKEGEKKKAEIDRNYIVLAKKNKNDKSLIFKVSRPNDKLTQIRIIPHYNHYVLEEVYQYDTDIDIVNKLSNEKINRCVAIDPGINNLCTVVTNFNNPSFIINGKIIKSINQYWNKKRSKAMSYIGDKGYSKRIAKLDQKRFNKIENMLHKISKYIISYCVENQVDTIIIGHNKGQKQNINIGKKNNQKFVSLPTARLIEKITYKANHVGIKMKVIEEDHTSKCNALLLEPIHHHEEYHGKRVKRGMYQSFDPLYIHYNADVNGALNIMRRVIGDECIKSFINNKQLLTPKKINIC